MIDSPLSLMSSVEAQMFTAFAIFGLVVLHAILASHIPQKNPRQVNKKQG